MKSTAWIRPRSAQTERAVAEITLSLPWAGNWSAEVELADPGPALTGLVTIGLLGRELSGQVVRGGRTKAGRVLLLVAGGSGHFGRQNPPVLGPKAYQNATLSKILSDLATESGETLGTLSDAVYRRTLAHWPRMKAAAPASLDRVAGHVGLIWRVQTDGKLWVGVPSWDEAATVPEMRQIEDAPEQSRTLYSLGSKFGPLPGQTYDGKRISEARYIVTASGEGSPGVGAFVSLGWHESDSEQLSSGQLSRRLAEVITQTVDTRFLRTYPARVVSQSADGTLEVTFDDTTLAGRKGVRYRALVDGAKLSVSSGARCVVSFDHGNPELAVADLFDPGSASRGVARHDDTVNCGTLTFLTVATGVLTGTYTPPGGAPLPFALGNPISLSGKIDSSSQKVFLP